MRQHLSGFLNSKFWRGLGHVFRVKTIGDLLGWWTTANWVKGVAVGIATLGTVVSWVAQAPRWLLPFELLALFAIFLWIAKTFTAGKSGGWSKDANKTSSPLLLNYKDFHSEGKALLTAIGGPSWEFCVAAFVNVAVNIPTPANNVRARVEYTHADGEVLAVREALWWTEARGIEFPSCIHIPSGGSARLCVCARQENGPVSVIENPSVRTSIKALKPGKWNVRIMLTLDNGPNYSGLGELMIGLDNAIAYRDPRFIFYEGQAAFTQDRLQVRPTIPRIDHT